MLKKGDCMQIKDTPIDQIKPYANNPRDNDDAVDATANSIKKFGWQQPIVVDTGGVIIVGHTRYKAAKKLGLKTIPVLVADKLTPEQVKAYRLADNKTGELADWDDDLLQSELDGLVDIDMSDFGFDPDITVQTETVDDDFDEPLPEKPKSKIGQIYQLGRHRLMCGDSTDGGAVAKLMNGQKADLLLTDPPYNVDYGGKSMADKKRSKTRKGETIKNDYQDDKQFLEFLTVALSNAFNFMKSGACFYIWYAQSQSIAFYEACRKSKLSVRQQLIWDKNSMVVGRQDYQWKHEPCLYGWAEGSSHSWCSDRKQTTVLNFDRPAHSDLHPTMKPIPLFDYQIKNSTKSGDIVLDLFGGSGTTIMACEQDGHNAYVMEYDPKYVDVIIDRWEQFTGKKAKLIEG
jgi:site-specific DNA-methyltransferase (adenine-specific)